MSDNDTDDSLRTDINRQSYTRALLYRGCLPALMIGDGTTEFVLSAGPRLQDAELAKEFALHLIGAALRLAGLCDQRMRPHRGWPKYDPERELEKDGDFNRRPNHD